MLSITDATRLRLKIKMPSKFLKLFTKSKHKGEKPKPSKNKNEKAEAEVYVEKIKEKLNDPEVAKKAAMIIEAMLTGKKNKKLPPKKKLLKTK